MRKVRKVREVGKARMEIVDLRKEMKKLTVKEGRSLGHHTTKGRYR